MRIRVPRRILLLGFVLAVLCALPAVTPSSSVAKPYNWDLDPMDPNAPGGPIKGDGDGGIVKASYIGGTKTYSATTSTTSTSSTSSSATVSTSQKTWSLLRTYLSLVRWGFGLR